MKTVYALDDQEHATVLAALRYYQRQGLADDPKLRPDAIHTIATAGDLITSLDDDGIDQLCERLNLTDAGEVGAALQLACRRAEAELGRWPETEIDSLEHRALRIALGRYQAALDRLR